MDGHCDQILREVVQTRHVVFTEIQGVDALGCAVFAEGVEDECGSLVTQVVALKVEHLQLGKLAQWLSRFLRENFVQLAAPKGQVGLPVHE